SLVVSSVCAGVGVGTPALWRCDHRRLIPARLGAPLGNDLASQMSRRPNTSPSYCENCERNSGAAITMAVAMRGPTTDRLPPITTAPNRNSESRGVIVVGDTTCWL